MSSCTFPTSLSTFFLGNLFVTACLNSSMSLAFGSFSLSINSMNSGDESNHSPAYPTKSIEIASKHTSAVTRFFNHLYYPLNIQGNLTMLREAQLP
ncbi:hypothetical protein GcM3_02963 [Golovinomyces cichoracearum]|uniref:Secreted protein n=1 Tax=Golovinomyces cichoracearum TaxID=62708 RepID=A0A420IFG0_9PEZI|nr:hypothetical protein GcM3_02963 [Golovinomyces cichoracearum]